MAEHAPSPVPALTPEHRRIAAERFERANQLLVSGNFDYVIQLLLPCCKLDPANLIYRQALRRAQRAKFKNNRRGSRLARITNSGAKGRLKAAKRAGEHLLVLEHGEEALGRNPWDAAVQLDMAESACALGLLDLAIWLLEEAREKDDTDVTINRSLARLYEQRGQFTQALALWDLVLRIVPADAEARQKLTDLAAHEAAAHIRQEKAIAEAEALEAEEEENDTETEVSDEDASQPPRLGLPADRVAREITSLQHQLENDPTNAELYLRLATLYRSLGQLDQAVEVLEEGLGPTGNQFELSVFLAELELEPFRRNLAIAEEKLSLQPNEEELRRIRIRLLKEINTRELDLCRQKADRFPTHSRYRLDLGVRLLRAGQAEEAIRELQVARQDDEQRWRAHLYLGYCFKDRDSWRVARRCFEEALQEVPADEELAHKELLFQLAYGHAEAGDLETAVDVAMLLANLDDTYRGIGQLLEEWQIRAQQPQADVSG
jgi:tetratricopeptide (TPR) repeat protein